MNELSSHVGGAADYDDFVRLFAELEIGDPVPAHADWLARLAPHTLFVRRGGENLAYAIAHRHGDAAYVAQVAVDPGARRRGVGRYLLHRLAERLRAGGCTTWRLNVKVGNEAAIRLYAEVGLEVHHRGAVLRLPWSIIERLPRAESIETTVPGPDRDAVLERRSDLIPGQIDRWRQQGDLLFAAGADRGFAHYVPALGAMPFVATDRRVTRALLEAMHPHAPPAATHLQVVVARQDDLALALRDAGAALVFELFHMRGGVPG